MHSTNVGTKREPLNEFWTLQKILNDYRQLKIQQKQTPKTLHSRDAAIEKMPSTKIGNDKMHSKNVDPNKSMHTVVPDTEERLSTKFDADKYTQRKSTRTKLVRPCGPQHDKEHSQLSGKTSCFGALILFFDHSFTCFPMLSLSRLRV